MPNFKLKYENVENIKNYHINAVVFNLHHIKQKNFLGGRDTQYVLLVNFRKVFEESQELLYRRFLFIFFL